jgi:ribosomal-protein-alanine N-acetyltransferase
MFEKLNTDRLCLRPIREDDAEIIFKKWAQDAAISKYMTWIPHTHIQTTIAFVKFCLEGWSFSHYTWLIEEINTGDVVGCFDATHDGHRLNIGYVIVKNQWGSGYMSEVVQSFIAEVFKNDEIFRVSAVCDIENMASKRVMEKAGMSYEGILKSWMIHPNLDKKPRDCHSLCAIRNV